MDDTSRTVSHCKCIRNRGKSGRKSRHLHGLAAWMSAVNSSRTRLCLLFILSLSIDLSYGNPVRFTPETPRFELSDTTTFQGKSSDGFPIQYYRHLKLHNDKLYVGAMNYLIQLNTNNISQNYRISQNITSLDVERNHDRCTQLRKTADFECQNHIRAIIPENNKLEVCGTAAYYPMKFTFDASDVSKTFQVSSSPEGARAWCSRDPADSCTSIHVRDGNPGNQPAMYSASIMDFSRSDPVIYRPSLGTDSELLRSDRLDKWLNKPTFVESFDVGEYVYFFLREVAIEYTNCGKAIYSRVARICKSDRGGSSRVLQNRWTTFLKARLNCSIPGEYPFYFNELYDVFQKDNKFYGVFTTNRNGMYGSAVCAFTNMAIDTAFNGPFKEQPGPNSIWIKVSEKNVPVPRPGQCTSSSQDTSDTSLQFIKARPLMDEAVTAESGAPLFYKQEVVYSKLVVDRINEYTVFFLATDEGTIHKVVTWANNQNKIESKTVTIWENFTRPNGSRTIQQMKLHDSYLYLSTDDEVLQMSVKQCGRYKYCTQCIQDPYCGWDIHWNICTTRIQDNGVVQDVKAEHPEKVCNNSCKHTDKHSHYIHVQGDPIHFNCSSRCEPSGDVTWYHKGAVLDVDSKKRFLTAENSLIVFNVTRDDQGLYECVSKGITLIKHDLKVNDCNDPESCWREEFGKWCREFENYKEELKHWQCLKNNCATSTDCKVDFSTCPAT